MAFFENLTKKVGEAAQTAAKKSGEMVEITKINMNIGSEEDKIQKLYLQIGKKVYEIFGADSELKAENFKDLCEQVNTHHQNIKDLKNKILEVKNIRICPSCGTELDKSVQFCNKCGTKQEEAETPVV